MSLSTSNLLSNKGVQWIGLGWTAFIAENLIVSENRDAIIKNLGDDNYHLVYNSLSTCACASIFYGYIKYRKTGPFISKPGVPRILFGYLSQNIGLVGLSQLFPKLQSPYTSEINADSSGPSPASEGPTSPENSAKMKLRCPMDFKPADIPANGIYGLDRVSRHSTFWSFGFLGVGRAVTTVFAPELVMFTFPIVFAAVGGWHQDQRHLRGSGGFLSQERFSKTSNIPFVALIQGKQSWNDLRSEIKWSNAAVALFLSSSLLMFKRVA